MTDWAKRLDEILLKKLPDLITLRRHLHQHPEISGEERETSLHLYQLLGDEQLPVRMGPEGRGVIAELQSDDAADDPFFALRADIDALQIHDAKQVDYRSQCDGVMHACGHDAHSTIMFGAMSVLSQLKQEGALPWPIRCRGIFQPAEETCEGAQAMIDVGALDHVEAIVAAHVDPSREVGHIGFRTGVLTANCDEIQITIHGRGGHAARPHEAKDPLAAAAQLINAFYTYIPRVTDSQEAVVVSVCHISAGSHANVIPETVHLRGTLRTLERHVREATVDHIERLVQGVAMSSDTRIDVTYGLSSPAVNNHEDLIALLRKSGEDVVGREGIDDISRPSMGSEDFSFYLQRVPGAMVRLGCRSDVAGGALLHSPDFDIDEEVLRVGVRLMARATINWWRPDRRAV